MFQYDVLLYDVSFILYIDLKFAYCAIAYLTHVLIRPDSNVGAKRRKARRRSMRQELDCDQTKAYRFNRHFMFNTTPDFYYFVARIIIIINFVQITFQTFQIVGFNEKL